MSDAILSVRDLRVSFERFTLGPVSFEVGPGITAVLGPNGSGKTTLMRAMNGLVPGAVGHVEVAADHGAPALDLRQRDHDAIRLTSFVPDGDEFLFPELDVAEYFIFLASVRHRAYGEDPASTLERAADISERLGLEWPDVAVGELSMGNRRKVALVAALMVRPRILIVDEPQNALDFVSSRALRAVLHEIALEGTAVLMSNHDLDSVARMADAVLILAEGELVASSQERFASAVECEAFVESYFSR